VTYYQGVHKRNEIDFGENTLADLEAVVNAADWIDDNRTQLQVPIAWRDHIDVNLLDLGDPHLCVLGQCRPRGFHDAMDIIDKAEDNGELTPYIFSSSDIQPVWVEYFNAHRLATNA
jgi:hypothetical protein